MAGSDIGYYTLPVIASMQGIDSQINKSLGAKLGLVGKKAGKDFGRGLADGSAADIKRLGDNYAKMYDKVADAAGKTKAAEAALQQLRNSGANNARVIAAEERHSKALRDQARFTREAKSALSELDAAKRRAGSSSGGLDAFTSQLRGMPGTVRAAGGALTAFAGGALVGVAAAATTAATALVGMTLFKGFQRLQSIDTAKFKLKALGNDAAAVTEIMDNALKSVKGTAFGLDEAATSAASAVAAGIKPGEDLTKYLTEIADAAAVAGTGFDEMGHIFNKVQTQNKAYTDDLQMLSDRGLPIFQWLREEYGVTADALQKMVEAGEVDAAHFQSAIDKHIGGAAQTMGQSFEGSVKNAEAALGRLGAALLTPVFGQAGDALGGLTTGLDKLTAWADEHQGDIANVFAAIGKAAIAAVQDVNKSVAEMARAIAQFVNAVGDVYGGLTRSVAAVNRVLGRTDIADQLDADADAAFGWGDSLYHVADSMDSLNPKLDAAKTSIMNWAGQVQNASGQTVSLGNSIAALPPGKDIKLNVDTAQAEVKMREFLGEWTKQIVLPVTAAPGAVPPGYNPLLPAGPAKASGGPIFGPGTGTSDSVPIMASAGEHMWTASEVNAVGGQGSMYRLRGLARRGVLKGFNEGGEITSDWYSSVAGTPYAMGGFGDAFDCSGAVSAGVNVAMGRQWNQGPPGGSPRMATGSEAEWLASQGFVMGVGPPGSIRVGWVNGGPGGGHTAMTLADGTNFESSSGKGVALGGKARGASDPMFTQHAYLPAGPQKPGTKGSPGSQSAGGGSPSSGGKSGGGGGGSSSLSDLAGGAVKIGIDGLLETIGADGSFLPENLGIPKTLMAALGLKFNTPAGSFSLSEGFKPAKTAANGTPGGGGTSFSPFGMQTTMPEVGSAASGTGTGPPPGPIDQSTNINLYSPTGDTTDLEKRVKTAVAPTRIDTHMPAGF